ncbi:unnamed protein product [Discosporangium mesarthrocarpum]
MNFASKYALHDSDDEGETVEREGMLREMSTRGISAQVAPQTPLATASAACLATTRRSALVTEKSTELISGSPRSTGDGNMPLWGVPEGGLNIEPVSVRCGTSLPSYGSGHPAAQPLSSLLPEPPGLLSNHDTAGYPRSRAAVEAVAAATAANPSTIAHSCAGQESANDEDNTGCPAERAKPPIGKAGWGATIGGTAAAKATGTLGVARNMVGVAPPPSTTPNPEQQVPRRKGGPALGQTVGTPPPMQGSHTPFQAYKRQVGLGRCLLTFNGSSLFHDLTLRAPTGSSVGC